jgi:hypothetical protein
MILAGGKILTSLWDSCSSHCLVSSSFAAELVRDGAKFARDVHLPMRQGKIWTGTIKSRVFCDISIAHKGKVKDFPNTCLYVWDTGVCDDMSSRSWERQSQIVTVSGV